MRLPRLFFWTKVFLGVVALTAIGLGVALAQIVPLQNLDLLGLIKGKNIQEVFSEGLGRRLTQPYQILVLGIDGNTEFKGRSDTMLLARFDNATQKINILAIPRDTRVKIPNFGYNKINAANVFGGANLAISTVQQKFNGVKVDRYIRIDTSGLDQVIDALGGIEVDVPFAMKYVDKTQKLYIDLQPGRQNLNGKQAEGFVRFRHDGLGDIGRVKRQQIILQALKAKISNPLVLIKLPEIIAIAQKHIDTNLSYDEIMALASFGASLKPQQVNIKSLGGVPSAPYQFDASYWLADQDDVDRAILGRFAL